MEMRGAGLGRMEGRVSPSMRLLLPAAQLTPCRCITSSRSSGGDPTDGGGLSSSPQPGKELVGLQELLELIVRPETQDAPSHLLLTTGVMVD